MLQRTRQLVALCLMAVSIALPSQCKADINVSIPDSVVLQIDDVAVQHDFRLKKPVTLSVRRMSLRDVLKQFAVQTGVIITIDDRDPSSNYPLLIECTQVPLAKMLNALYGLFSIQGGEWAWVRYGKEDAYTYTLHETAQAKNRNASYNRILRELMNGYVAALRQLAPMPMEVRKRYRNVLKRALHLDDDTMTAFFFENEAFWNEANFFFGALTPEQQNAVLGNGSASVSLKMLPQTIYALFHQSFLAMNFRSRNAEGVLVSNPEPDTVQFYQSSPDFHSERFAPAIQLAESRFALSWMGTGHLEPGIRNAMKHAWMLPGDSATDPASQTIVREPKETEATRQERSNLRAEEDRLRELAPEQFSSRPVGFLGASLGFNLEQLAQGSATPTLAILPPEAQGRFSAPVGKPVQAFLDRVEGTQKRYFYKWRDGILLVMHPLWFAEPVSVIPFSLMADIHPDKVGHIAVSALANLMSRISEDQAQWFAAEAGMGDWKQLRLWLLLASNEPRVLQPDGVRLDSDIIRYLQSATFPHSALPPNTQFIRIREEMPEGYSAVSSFLCLEAYNSEQQRWFLLNRLPLPLFREVSSPKAPPFRKRSQKVIIRKGNSPSPGLRPCPS